jgi:hypothetical protein
MLQFAPLKFLTFYLRADTSYSVHSPFVYRLASQIVDNKAIFSGRRNNAFNNGKINALTDEYQLFAKIFLNSFKTDQYFIFSTNGDVFKTGGSDGSGVNVFFLHSSFLLLQEDFIAAWDRMQSTDSVLVCFAIRASESSLEHWKQFCNNQASGILIDAWSWGCFRRKAASPGLQKYSLVPSKIKPLSFRQFFPHVKQV